MGDWYEIGITVGLGVAAGIAFAGVLAGLRFGFATTLLGALVVGVVAGLLVNGWIGVAGGVVGAVIGSRLRRRDRARCGPAGRDHRRHGVPPRRGSGRRRPARAHPRGRLSRGRRAPHRRCAARAPRAREVRRAPFAREVTARPLILVVIDGLTPSMLEGAIGSGETPTLAALAAGGSYRRATSVFPSLTPVCLSSIATGAHGDVHEIPHLVWYDRGEQTDRRVRQLVRRGPCRRHRPDAAGHARQHEQPASRGEGPDDVRVARRRRPPHRRGQLHRLPGQNAPPVARSRSSRTCWGRSGSSSTTSSAPTAPARRSRGATGLRDRSMPTRRRSAAGSSRATRSTSSSSISPTTTTPPTSTGPTRRSRRSQRCDAARRLARRGRRRDRCVPRAVRGRRHGRPRPDARAQASSLAEVYAGVDGVLPLASNRAAHLYLQPGMPARPARRRGPARRRRLPPRSRCSARARDAVARREGEELVFAPAAGGGFRSPVTPRFSDTRTRSPARGQRSRTRTRARFSSRRRRGTSSPTSVGAAMSAVARTARSSRATRRCRCSPWASRATAASIVDVAPLVLAHFGVDRSRATRSTAPPEDEPLPSPNVIEPPPTTSGQGAAQRVGSALGRAEQLGAARQVLHRRRQPATSSTSRSSRSSSRGSALHYIPAAVGSFLVAVANNYALNRVWTFRVERGDVA